MDLNIGSRIANTARAIRDYARPRPDTTGDAAVSLWASGGLAGAFQGWISGGPIIGAAGLLGGASGVKVGEMVADRYQRRALDRAGDALLARVLPNVAEPERATIQAQVAAIKTRRDASAILAANGTPVRLTPGENMKTFLAGLGGGAVTGALCASAITAALAVAAPALGSCAPLGGALIGAVFGAAIAAPQRRGWYPNNVGVPFTANPWKVLLGVTAGIALGAGAGFSGGALLAPILATVTAPPLALSSLAVGGLLGGFAGVVGTLSGSRRASTRDGAYGGMMLGLLVRGLSGNPFTAIAAAAGGGIGGKAPTAIGRVVLGGVAGAASGAASAVFGGPAAMGIGAAVGAGLGAGGALVGPVVRQVMRNMTVDMSKGIINKIDPFVARHPLSRGTKIVLGGVATSLMLGPLGMLFGLKGVEIGAGIGFALGSIKTWQSLRKRDAAKRADAEAVAGTAAASPAMTEAPSAPAATVVPPATVAPPATPAAPEQPVAAAQVAPALQSGAYNVTLQPSGLQPYWQVATHGGQA